MKFLYNIVPVNSNLYKWNLLDCDECPECHVKEDISHAFLFCNKIRTFWRWLENVVYNLKEIYATFKMSYATLIYSFNIGEMEFKLLNFIINCALFLKVTFLIPA